MADKLVQIRALFDKEHKIGGKVPNGGSNCAKCEYLADNKKDCKNEKFQAWQKLMGVKKPEVIPGDIKEYCCDFFPVDEKKSKKPKVSTSKLLNLK